MNPLLDLKISAWYGSRQVLGDVAFQIAPGEVLGLAGASGCGKSTCALALLGLLGLKGGRAKGSILFQGQELTRASETEMRQIRGRRIGLVPQSPIASLNPALRIGAQLKEAWYAHAGRGEDWREPVAAAFRSVSLPADAPFLDRYPRQLSVGLAQRVLIAMAILHRPKLLIADEATSALDPLTQSEILTLFEELTRKFGMAMLYVSHDLLSMTRLCHRVAILHEGSIVETGPVRQVFDQPSHPYAKKLMEALPARPVALGAGEENRAAAQRNHLAGLSANLLVKG
jgi:ABC-type dipeptide/oligopeptide/nickel transport system ATPase component